MYLLNYILIIKTKITEIVSQPMNADITSSTAHHHYHIKFTNILPFFTVRQKVRISGQCTVFHIVL